MPNGNATAGHRWREALVWLIPLLTACATAPAGRLRAPALEDVVDSTVTTPPLDRTHWGIELYDLRRGRAAYRLNPDKHFVPASNQKLVVTAVALAELGPDYRYRTELYAPGDAGDSVAASLVVVGSGDPTLSARFFGTDLAPVEALADSVRLAGIRRIDGDLVVDASRFDAEAVHPTWEVGDLAWYYAAPVAAFAIAEAAAPLVVTPGASPGEPAVLSFPEPAEAFVVTNRAVTDTAGAETDLDVRRAPGSYALDVSGTVALDQPPDTLWLAVVDPVVHAARALEAALERRGIDVAGGLRVVRDSAEAASLLGPRAVAAAGPDTPAAGRDTIAAPGRDTAATTAAHTAGARRVATWSSPPLREIVAGILKPSQNWIAEQLLKTLGAERAGQGSWRAGLEVERRYLFDTVGIDSAAVVPVDGSGLSAQNLLTPHAVVQLLEHASRQPWGQAYRDALPAPGEPEGTLETRLQGLEGSIRAKTGTIAHVNSLSGYLRAGDGRDFAFSVLTNASGVRAGDVRRAIDRIARAMAASGGRR